MTNHAAIKACVKVSMNHSAERSNYRFHLTHRLRQAAGGLRLSFADLDCQPPSQGTRPPEREASAEFKVSLGSYPWCKCSMLTSMDSAHGFGAQRL
jgi:hypothetical protein